MAASRWFRRHGPTRQPRAAALMDRPARRRPRRPWAGWRICWLPARWFRLFPPGTATAGSRLHASHRPRRTPVQPVQLSLLPDQVPAPPVMLIAQLPGTHVAAAVTLLAGLMGRAAMTAQPG